MVNVCVVSVCGELKKSQPFEAAPESGGAFLHAGLNNVFCPLIKNKK